MGSEKVIASIELSNALGLPVGVPVTPAKLEQEVKRHTKAVKLVKLANQTISVNQAQNDRWFDQRLPTFAKSNYYGVCEIRRTVYLTDEHHPETGGRRGYILTKKGKLIVDDYGNYWEIKGPLILVRPNP